MRYELLTDLENTDPRFVPYSALVHYNIGSDVNTIDRVYGTVEQKIQYPKLTDFLISGNI